jgi:hypothetical protein
MSSAARQTFCGDQIKDRIGYPERGTHVREHKCRYSSPPVSAGDTFQDLPRMPETADSKETYIYIYIYI